MFTPSNTPPTNIPPRSVTPILPSSTPRSGEARSPSPYGGG